MTRTLLVTNDFPPKVGGIQSYLEALWCRLDPSTLSVLTARSHHDWAAFDEVARAEGRAVDRVAPRTLYVPTAAARRAIDDAVAGVRPDLVLYDPFVPLGLVGRRPGPPYGVVLHGAEVTVPARLPVLRRAAASVLGGAAVVVAAGRYPADEARRLVGDFLPPVVQVPPGVDVSRYAPLDPPARAAARERLGLGAGPLVVSVGRLVPRKGLDVLIAATARLGSTHPGLLLAIAGDGRDAGRLRRLAGRARAPVRFLGRVADADKAALLGAADVFAQPCRTRWGGLEQEGFGIVFLEAAACGVPQVAGRSGGADEAVLDGATGFVVDTPRDTAAVALALDTLLGDEARRCAMGAAALERARREFDYDVLARRLAAGLDAAIGGAAPSGS